MSTPAQQVRERAVVRYGVLDTPPRPELLALAALAARCAQVPRAAITLVTATEQRQVATYGFTPAVGGSVDAMCTWAVDERRAIVVPDAGRDERFRHGPGPTGARGAVGFYAAHPLTTPEGVVIGTLCVFDEQPHAVDAALESSLATLADRVVDVLELELASRRLATVKERLASFAGQVSHDLKNPLSSIRLSVELARDEVAGSDETIEQLLLRAERGAERLNARIDDLLAAARSEWAQGRGDVALDDVVQQVVAGLAEPAGEGQVEVAGLPVVTGDAVQLRTVVQHLLANALRVSPAGAPVRVSGERLPSGWWVGVADCGPGVAASDPDGALGADERPGHTGPDDGAGLAACRRVVEAHGGLMGIDDDPGGGAVVWFTLPG